MVMPRYIRAKQNKNLNPKFRKFQPNILNAGEYGGGNKQKALPNQQLIDIFVLIEITLKIVIRQPPI